MNDNIKEKQPIVLFGTFNNMVSNKRSTEFVLHRMDGAIIIVRNQKKSVDREIQV